MLLPLNLPLTQVLKLMLTILLLLAAKTGEKPAIRVMATVMTTIKNVLVYSNGDAIRYRVSFADAFDGISKNDDGEYAEAKVNYIDFVPRHIIALVLENVSGADLLYTEAKERALRNGEQGGFGAAQLQVLLRGAKITLEREKFVAGDEYVANDGETCTHEHDGYNTSVTSIEVTERIQSKLDMLADKILGF